MAESPLKRLLVQASHYSAASLLATVSGLISFPLLTRIFSVADYGVMNLVSVTLAVTVALGKVGLQHSIIRYQTEIRSGKGKFTAAQVHATALIGMSVTGLGATLILVAGARCVPASWLGDSRLRQLFTIAGLVVLIQVVESALLNFLRADQETSLFMKYQVAKKYLGLALILFAVFVVSKTLTAFYSALLVSEALAVAWLALLFIRRDDSPPFSPRDFSRPLYLELLGFGIPMMIGYEMSGIVLATGDRYVIHGTIGATQLGLYSAAYNLCQYVQSIFIASVGQAVMPLYLQMWDQKGVEETTAFIGRSLRTYILFGAPVIAGLAVVGPELLRSLAGNRYASAAVILPWVIAGMVVDGANSMLAAGLFIHRKTRHIMVVVLTSAALNLLLNLILVPRIGIMGAAIATLVSYVLASFALALAGRRLLPIKIPWATILRAGLASFAMYALLTRLVPGRHALTVGVRCLVGAPVYLLLVAAIDLDARALRVPARGRLWRWLFTPQSP